LGIFLVSDAFGWSLSTHQEAPSSEVESYIQVLGHINSPSISESAGSHGSYGTFVGMGLQESKVQPSILMDENLKTSTQSATSTYSMIIPKAYLTKGLPIPVDFTLSAAKISEKVNQLGLTTQVTFFQSRAWPSFAARGSYGTIIGVPETDFSTTSFSLVTSYSLLSYFTFFGEIMQAQHLASIRPAESNKYTFLLLTEANDQRTFSTYRREMRGALGLQIAMLTTPLFFTIQFERSSYQEINQTAKVTVMF
jgi:hypothetical protein